MTLDRPEHRALVEAGYAPLPEYVRKYSMTQTVSERLRKTSMQQCRQVPTRVVLTCEEAADWIDELVEALVLWLHYDEGNEVNGIELMTNYNAALIATKDALAKARGERA